MNVLILGSGGREHALAWRMAQDPSATQVFVWPGNAGMTFLPFAHKDKLHSLSESFDQTKLKEIIQKHKIDLVVPGAEKFLYQGVADWCESWNVPCFGPKSEAAELEKSKLFSKKVMSEARIPTARYVDLTLAFNENLESAFEILQGFRRPVIKISGPSLGKGVFVCNSPREASETLTQIKASPMEGLEEGIFVEEGLSGKEISLFYACHGENFQFLGAAQDHKRLNDNDEGPNTGGMGTISPVKWADKHFIQEATHKFLIPTLKSMQERGTPFKGVLFLGLMVDEEEMNLLEYNVRFGDPETQVILPLIEGDFTQTLYDISSGKKTSKELSIKPLYAVHVVKAAKGYPGMFGDVVEKGQKIVPRSLHHEGFQFFFAGVKSDGPDLITDGGRVLGITAWEKNKDAARALAYQNLTQFTFAGEHYRRDIGNKE